MGTLYKRRRRDGSLGKTWHAEYTDHEGTRIQRSTQTTVKSRAQLVLAKWELHAHERASGLIDPAQERMAQQSQRGLSEHVREFVASLESAGRSRVHIDRTKARINKVIAAAEWSTLSDITPESVEDYAAGLRRAERSHQTISHHLQAVKQFARWLARTGRLPANPLESVRKPNPEADRRHERRMLLPAEWPWLRDAAGGRALLYELAIITGLRSSELRALTSGHLHLTAKPAYVTVPSGNTKDSKLARQYITSQVSSSLKRLKRRRGPVFDLPQDWKMAGMIRTDLAAAREAWAKKNKRKADSSDFLLTTNDAGEVFDFHSLRHTCGAWLALRNVHPKTIQTIMRHKSITLTMDRYGHLFPDAEPAAVQQLEALLCQ